MSAATCMVTGAHLTNALRRMRDGDDNAIYDAEWHAECAETDCANVVSSDRMTDIIKLQNDIRNDHKAGGGYLNIRDAESLAMAIYQEASAITFGPLDFQVKGKRR